MSAMCDRSRAKSTLKIGAAWSVILSRQRSRASAKTGQLMRVWAPMLSMWVRSAVVP
jgi:hypothetical protein